MGKRSSANHDSIIYQRKKDKNQPPMIFVNGVQLNVPIDITMQDDRLLRELYNRARKAKLVEDNQEVCRATGMKPNYLAVWLSDRNHHLSPDYRMKFVTWWNKCVVNRPPHIAAYLFNTIPAETITWDRTFKEALSRVKEDAILCIVQKQGKLVGILDHTTACELARELPEDHVSLETTLEAIVKRRVFIPYSFEEMRWDTDSSEVFKILKGKFVVVEDDEREIESVIPPLPEISTYAPVRTRSAETYALHELTKLIADYHARYIMQDFLLPPQNKIKVMDVGTGSGTFAIPFAKRWRQRNPKGFIQIDAVEREEEKGFENVLGKKIEQEDLSKVVSPKFKGVDDLTSYGKDYDLVVWHLVLPTRTGTETASTILRSGGIVSVAYYDARTMKEINGILTDALVKKMRCLPEQTLLSVLKTEVLDLSRFVANVIPADAERRFVCSHPVTGHFEDAQSFLEFWSSASPLVCGVLSTFDDYPLLRKRTWDCLLEEVQDRFGIASISQELYVNFIVGQK